MSAFPIPRIVLCAVATAAAIPARARLPAQPDVARRMRALEAATMRWLIAYSVAILRISIGAVFLGFGVLKFFPNVSPAQDLVEATTTILTFGLVPGGVALVAVATLESVIGLCLLVGRGMRIAVYLLVIALVGILSPIVLLPGRLFSGAGIAPTLEGQYVLKDLVMVGAAFVLAASAGGARLAARRDGTAGL